MTRVPGQLWTSYPLRRARLAVRVLTFMAPVLVAAAIFVRACAPDASAGMSPAKRPLAPAVVAEGLRAADREQLEASPPTALLMPVEGVEPAQLRDNFNETRGGSRSHEAIDILAPRNTPVLAVADGTVAKLWQSVPGGITIYQFDSSGQYCYYYAHLERYARGIANGDRLRRGQVIGFVGTSGNAPRDTPHLHFAIYRLGAERRWWEGEPLNPFPLLRNAATSASSASD
ncbi:MAG: M23 family metallopeptidase [Thermoanaerobaculia bacterium]